jgi:pterin-4a-carbinolamine dehydratase
MLPRDPVGLFPGPEDARKEVSMSPWPAPERRPFTPRSGVLHGWELRRALADRPDWRLDGERLVRRERGRDFLHALELVHSVAAEAEDFGRHPSVHIDEVGHITFSISNPHHAGVTVAELRLADKVDAALAHRHQPLHA